MNGPLRGLGAAGADLAGYRRLVQPLYEIEPDADALKAKAKEAPTKTANEPLPAKGEKGKSPGRTRGAPAQSRTDPLPSSGKDLTQRIKELSAELRKKYGLPRETGERAPKPPPEETPEAPAATGPAAKK